MSRRHDHQENPYLADRLTFFKPIMIGGISLAPPFVLIFLGLTLSQTSFGIFVLSYVAYSYLGKKLVEDDDFDDDEDDDDEDIPNTDFLALGAALASAGLLSPEGLILRSTTITTANLMETDGTVSPYVYLAICGMAGFLVIAYNSIGKEPEEKEDLLLLEEEEEEPVVEKELMQLWDRKLQNNHNGRDD